MNVFRTGEMVKGQRALTCIAFKIFEVSVCVVFFTPVFLATFRDYPVRKCEKVVGAILGRAVALPQSRKSFAVVSAVSATSLPSFVVLVLVLLLETERGRKCNS